jgi:hypothetical protein
MKIDVENLPDFDELIALTGEIGGLKTTLMVDKASLERLEAEITQRVTDLPQYHVGEKPPSMAYIKSHYHVLGCDEDTDRELGELKAVIAGNEGKLREKELLFQVYRDMIDVWRTESANKRGAFFEGS